MDSTVDVELEFIPTAAATEYGRASITESAGSAGLLINRWSTARRSDQRAAVPSLDIRLSSRIVARDYRRGDLTRALAPQLRDFCAALRTTMPELPFGIIEQVARQTTWFGFRLNDPAAEIVRALDALADVELPRRGKAFGWDASSGTWLRL